ncbi:type II toxin-antitoxin system HicB family antitoxin [Natronomonas sp. EA1]|uniref:type II toxin-antitoxin system HicB family antitoxin n=1 Tax=Natronomonas sp. EA1 TaxID=3421655 RepID=UPI003EC0EC00
MTSQLAPADFELTQDGDLWVALHVKSGVASQGSTPSEAVEMAMEAAKLSQQKHHAGDEAYQQEMLEECGINLDEVSESIETPNGMP